MFMSSLSCRSFLSRLDSLVQRLKNSRIHRCDDIDRRVKFFFGHPGFPCVRKAAFHSWIAKPHHRHGKPHEHLLALREAGYRVRIPVERAEISFIQIRHSSQSSENFPAHASGASNQASRFSSESTRNLKPQT
jgi:hypothetical protein